MTTVTTSRIRVIAVRHECISALSRFHHVKEQA